MEDDEEKPITIFGKNIAEIPCFRDSYFYGIWSGFAGGIGYFMYSSKISLSTHVGMGTFCISTLTYWTYCRWKYSERMKEGAILKKYIEERNRKEKITSEKKEEIVTV